MTDQIYRVNTTGEFLSEYREKCSIIRRHNPSAEIPPETDGINALLAVREMVRKIEFPAAPGPTPADRLRAEVSTLQTAVAGEISNAVRLGIVKQEDFFFPDESLPWLERKSKLLAMRSRVYEAKRLHDMPPEMRARYALIEVQNLKGEVGELRASLRDAMARIGALEQERASDALRN